MDRTEITVHKPALNPEAVGIYLWSTIFRILVRTTVLWAGFAILAPALGIAWYMVFIGLIMLNHLLWVPTEASVVSANKMALTSQVANAEKKAKVATRKDNEIFANRVNAEHMG